MPAITPRRVEKPWGYELIWAHTDRHLRKDETVRVLSGILRFQTGSEGEPLTEARLAPGDTFHITPLLRHRMIAETDCDVLEVSTPELDDVVRLEDRYGRTK